ncbi:MAG: head GIN domain-containing protein, partial [Owenweeksia sp.]
MKKNILFMLFALFSTFAIPLIAGETTRESRDVSAFSEVEVGSALVVEIRKGNAHSLELEGRPEDLKKVTTAIKGGELSIKLKSSEKVKTVKVFITMPELKGVDLSGSSNMKVLDVFKAEHFDMDLSGASTLEIELDCSQSLDIHSSGASVLNLKGSAPSSTINGSGASTLNARGFTSARLKADLSGATKLKIAVKDGIE